MLFSSEFSSFSRKTCTLNDWVAAPYMCRDFTLSEISEKADRFSLFAFLLKSAIFCTNCKKPMVF